MQYLVKRLPAETSCMPLKGAFDPNALPEPYRSLETASIDHYLWDETGYMPRAFAKVGWNDSGLHVLLAANEETIQANCREIGGRVCEDSCLEFFLMPFPAADRRYYNFEMNPLGTLHMGLGEGRPARVKTKDALPDGFDIYISAHSGGWWAVSYTVPMTVLTIPFRGTLASGSEMLGNFYKCDESVHPHFGSWAPVTAPKPDFHRPECFRQIILE